MLREVSQNLPRWFERILAVDSFNSDLYILALKSDTVIEMLKQKAEQTYRLYFRQDKKDKTRAVLWYKFGKNSFRRRMSLHIQEHEKGTKIIAEYKLSAANIILIISAWVVVLLATSLPLCIVTVSLLFPQSVNSSMSNLETLLMPIIPIVSLLILFQFARGFAYLETSKTKENFNSIFREHIIETSEV